MVVFDSTVTGPMIIFSSADLVPAGSDPEKMRVSSVFSSSGLLSESIRSASTPLKSTVHDPDTWACAGVAPMSTALHTSKNEESLRATR